MQKAGGSFPHCFLTLDYLVFFNQLHVGIEKVDRNVPVFILEKPGSDHVLGKVDSELLSNSVNTLPFAVLAFGVATRTENAVFFVTILFFALVHADYAVCRFGVSEVNRVPHFTELVKNLHSQLTEFVIGLFFALNLILRLPVFIDGVKPSISY